MSFSILGTGSALPRQVVTNDVLSHIVDTSDEWIQSRTGIAKRHVSTGETAADLAYQAAMHALADSGVHANELDLIICATISGDYATPSMACIVQARLGAACPAFDINAACTGFVYGLDVAAGYFARKPNQKILLVAAERMSRIVDWTDRSTCVLFGDGAGAVVLGEGHDLLAIQIGAEGKVAPLYAKNPQGNSPFAQQKDEIIARDCYIKMDGQEVFRFAVTAMTETVEHVLKEANLQKEDLAYLLPHQANIRIIDAACSRLKLAGEKCLRNIAECGNTSAAGIAILLDEAAKSGKFRKGDILAFTAFGGGLTTGACILRWNK